MKKIQPGNPSGVYAQIYAMVRRVPAGRVATYGQIAKLVGGCSARQVGYALAALPDGTDVPWQRIINGGGRISERSSGDNHSAQQRLLEKEGVRLGADGGIDLRVYRWGSAAADPPLGPDLFDA